MSIEFSHTSILPLLVCSIFLVGVSPAKHSSNPKTYRAEGRGNMVSNASTKMYCSCSAQHSRTVPSTKKAGIFPVHVWGLGPTVQLVSPGAYPLLASPNIDLLIFPVLIPTIVTSRILHFFICSCLKSLQGKKYCHLSRQQQHQLLIG